MNLTEAQIGLEYTISNIETFDEELDTFLLSLGCYKGASITVMSKLRGGYVVAIKDARYTIDSNLAEAILI